MHKDLSLSILIAGFAREKRLKHKVEPNAVVKDIEEWGRKTFTLHCTVKRRGKHFCRMIFFFKNIYTYSWKVEGYTNILGLIEFPIFFTGLFQISRVVVLVAKLCPTLATPWTVALQAPLFMEFSRREYWSGLPFTSSSSFFFFCHLLLQGIFPIQGLNLCLLRWQLNSLLTELP